MNSCHCSETGASLSPFYLTTEFIQEAVTEHVLRSWHSGGRWGHGSERQEVRVLVGLAKFAPVCLLIPVPFRNLSCPWRPQPTDPHLPPQPLLLPLSL